MLARVSSKPCRTTTKRPYTKSWVDRPISLLRMTTARTRPTVKSSSKNTRRCTACTVSVTDRRERVHCTFGLPRICLPKARSHRRRESRGFVWLLLPRVAAAEDQRCCRIRRGRLPGGISVVWRDDVRRHGEGRGVRKGPRRQHCGARRCNGIVSQRRYMAPRRQIEV